MIETYLKLIYDPRNTPSTFLRKQFVNKVLMNIKDIKKNGEVDRVFGRLERLVVGEDQKESFLKEKEDFKRKIAVRPVF